MPLSNINLVVLTYRQPSYRNITCSLLLQQEERANSLIRLSIEGQESGGVAGLVLVLGDVVLELLGLGGHVVGDVLALGLLDHQAQDGGLELEDLVLYLAALEGVGLLAVGRVDGRVERLLLGVVADPVHRVQEVDVRLRRRRQVVHVQRAEHRQRLLLRVARHAPGDGDVVVRLLREGRLALLQQVAELGVGGGRGERGCREGGDDGDRETHGCGLWVRRVGR